MALQMENSLKLSYDMLFQSGNQSYEEEGNEATVPEPEVLTPQEVEALLKEQNEEWETRLQQETQKARQAGMDEGYAKGKEEAEANFEDQIGGIKEIMNAMDNEFNQALEELKPHIAELVFEITEKVLDIPFDNPVLRQRVQDEVIRIVELLDEELHIKVTVSENDFKLIEKAFENHGGIAHFTLRSDDHCNPGEYVIETPKESIIKNFNKMVADFKESISFADVENPELQP